MTLAGSAEGSAIGPWDADHLTLATTQSLPATEVPVGAKTINTLGYARIGDGGGAVFQRVEITPRADDIRSADGAAWRMRAEAGVVNVRQCGAAGDESRDDTDAIRAAFAFLREEGASTLFFPPGTYRVSGPIISFAAGDKRFAIIGQNADTTRILLAASIPEPLISIVGEPGRGRIEWISFSELTFVNRNRRFRGDAVLVRFAYHIDWKRCRWLNFDGRALTLDNYWDSNFSGCRFIGCGRQEPAGSEAAGLEPVAPTSAIWIGCSEQCDSSNNLNFVNCQFEASWHHQVEIDFFSRRINFVSCKFHGLQRAIITAAQVLIRGGRSGKFIGCAFAYGQEHDHISFVSGGLRRRGQGWIITACDFSYSAKAAVRVRSTSELVIAHNNFGAIGENAETVVLEGYLRDPVRDGRIILGPNTFSKGETEPVVEEADSTAPTRSKATKALSERWDEEHLRLGRYHLWVDEEGILRMKDGQPQHDQDGRPV
ncbi:glycosyl hydrolase family 28-related protein [Sulfitobacter indolifex]|uniref:glycosyl hydrolase family 28-related protein n=1 Tax=Sulfitobacter indolifex TaxID=225422 RepID=UPI0013EF8927|nr:glycosyl hydrolase family 28-related protein [Sulfitobacter indolifex]